MFWLPFKIQSIETFNLVDQDLDVEDAVVIVVGFDQKSVVDRVVDQRLNILRLFTYTIEYNTDEFSLTILTPLLPE